MKMKIVNLESHPRSSTNNGKSFLESVRKKSNNKLNTNSWNFIDQANITSLYSVSEGINKCNYIKMISF